MDDNETGWMTVDKMDAVKKSKEVKRSDRL